MSTQPHTHQSSVKWFDAKKGYGFINHPEGGEDVFVHYSQIETDDDFKTLRTGQTVRFEMDDGPKGLHALKVLPIEDEQPAADAREDDRADEPEPSEPSDASMPPAPPDEPETDSRSPRSPDASPADPEDEDLSSTSGRGTPSAPIR